MILLTSWLGKDAVPPRRSLAGLASVPRKRCSSQFHSELEEIGDQELHQAVVPQSTIAGKYSQ
jgi:hypothetical protein